jgi:hypothetical protein
MECHICIRLASERVRTDGLHLEAFRLLNAVAGKPDAQEFSRVAALVIDAKLNSDIARLELELHQAGHRGASWNM